MKDILTCPAASCTIVKYLVHYLLLLTKNAHSKVEQIHWILLRHVIWLCPQHLGQRHNAEQIDPSRCSWRSLISQGVAALRTRGCVTRIQVKSLCGTDPIRIITLNAVDLQPPLFHPLCFSRPLLASVHTVFTAGNLLWLVCSVLHPVSTIPTMCVGENVQWRHCSPQK